MDRGSVGGAKARIFLRREVDHRSDEEIRE
jgi:hypothetical protein